MSIHLRNRAQKHNFQKRVMPCHLQLPNFSFWRKATWERLTRSSKHPQQLLGRVFVCLKTEAGGTSAAMLYSRKLFFSTWKDRPLFSYLLTSMLVALLCLNIFKPETAITTQHQGINRNSVSPNYLQLPFRRFRPCLICCRGGQNLSTEYLYCGPTNSTPSRFGLTADKKPAFTNGLFAESPQPSGLFFPPPMDSSIGICQSQQISAPRGKKKTIKAAKEKQERPYTNKFQMPHSPVHRVLRLTADIKRRIAEASEIPIAWTVEDLPFRCLSRILIFALLAVI